MNSIAARVVFIYSAAVSPSQCGRGELEASLWKLNAFPPTLIFPETQHENGESDHEVGDYPDYEYNDFQVLREVNDF